MKLSAFSKFLIYAGAIGLLISAVLFFITVGISFLWFFCGFAFACLAVFGLISAKARSSGLRRLFRALRIFMLAMAVVFIVSFVLVESEIIKASAAEPQPGADYIIVLGAKLYGETPSASLAARLNAALEYLRENPRTLAVVCGGKGRGEAIPEALAMKNYLTARGIDERRIITESSSRDTKQNFENAAAIIGDGHSVVVVTNDYHIYRSLILAGRAGFEASGLPAKTPAYPLLRPASYLREYFSVMLMYLGL